MREITAFSNSLVKRVRSLRDKKHRRDEGLFLAEGLRILTEAREAGHLPDYLFFAKGHDTHKLAAELIGATEAAGGEVIAGINLPMLIRLGGARKTMKVTEAVAAAREAGRKYITVASEVLGEAAA